MASRIGQSDLFAGGVAAALLLLLALVLGVSAWLAIPLAAAVYIGIVLVRPNLNNHGVDFIHFTLPASLAGAGDVPVQVQFTRGGVSTVSRPAATAPHITIN